MQLDNLVSLLEVFQDEERSLNLAINADLLYDNGACFNPKYTWFYKIVNDNHSQHHRKFQCQVCGDSRVLFFNSIFTRSKLPV